MKLAITGTSGYIGGSLVRCALEQGHEVLHLTRRKPVNSNQWIPFDIDVSKLICLERDVTAVVHLAINPRAATQNQSDSEIVAAKNLMDAAAVVGARFVFVSSQTASAAAPTLYGQTKWRIEQLVLQRGGIVVRPGQVYGGEEKGLFGLLVGLVARFPLLPAFLPSPEVQPVHVDDLSLSLLRTAQNYVATPAILSVAQSHPISFTSFLKAIAVERLQKRRLLVPVPAVLVRAVVWALGKERSSRMGLSRLESLFDLPHMDSQESLDYLGLKLRPLQEGMRRPPELVNDALEVEARTLLRYVLKVQPDASLIKGYVDMIKTLKAGASLCLPDFITKKPVLLLLLDDQGFLASARGKELAWRLDAATLLAEATPRGAAHFLGVGRRDGLVLYSFLLTKAMVMELCSRLARAIAMPLFLRDAIDRSFP